MPENEINSVGGSDTNNVEAIATISDEVTKAVNQLPESQQAGLPGIKEILTQLQSRIEGNADLPSSALVEALKQVKILAEVGNNPQAQSKRSDAQRAIKALREMFGELPNATNFMEACTQLLPDIAEIFGLG